MFKINTKKVYQDFGSVAKMAKASNINKSTLEHIIYKKKSIRFNSDSVREVVNGLIAKGYLLYADEIGSESKLKEA